MSQSNAYFPSIGTVAEQADNLPDEPADAHNAEDDDDERPTQEIESLCMKCGEQVRGIFDGLAGNQLTQVGND